MDQYYNQALNLIASGRARDAFALDRETEEMRDRYGRNTFGQSCLLARRLLEAGTRVVEVIWPKVANSDNHSWDHHVGLTERMKTKSGPMLDQGLSALFDDLDSSGLLDETLVVALGEFGRSPEKGVSHQRQRQQRRRSRPLALLLHAPSSAAQASSAATSTASPTRPAPRLPRDPVHPTELLATIYHAMGIDPETDRLQPSQPAPRAGEGEARDAVVCVTDQRPNSAKGGCILDAPPFRAGNTVPVNYYLRPSFDARIEGPVCTGRHR